MNKYTFFVFSLLLAVTLGPTAYATTDCTFTTLGTIMTLDNDCTTDETLVIPDGYTLTGDHNTITAVDPVGGHFEGAVVMNGGTTAYIERVIVSVSGLADVCDAGAERLRGIMFEGASGSILYTRVIGVNQGPSGCQEGNAIEVRNAPFDGSHPNTMTVEVAHNRVEDYQKTGILANGDVNVNVHHNTIGASATQANLAANSLQLGFGALGSVMNNAIKGNQWLGASDFASTAMLIYASDVVEVAYNAISGNSDVGMYVITNDSSFHDNTVYDLGPDAAHGDYGIFDDGTGNSYVNNIIRGFVVPFESSMLLVETLAPTISHNVMAFE